MKLYLMTTFYAIMVIINVAVVTIVYYYNRHPIGTLNRILPISPQKLCQHIYEARKKPPEAFTYDKLADGKYVIYRLDYGSGLYRRSAEDYPVDVDGHQWIPQNNTNSEITYTKTGFKIPGIPNELTCPFRWYWDQKQGKCVESPLCPHYDNSILPLLNAYYSEITNPATTMHTKLTDQVIHQKMYIQCSKDEKKPIIKTCSENTFVKMSTYPFDESKIVHIPPLESGQPNVNALCKRYDVCEDRLDGSIHRFLISDDSNVPLEKDEYFICKNGKSERRKCEANYKVNPDMEHVSGHLCVPINHCDNSHEFYFRINNDAFGYCQAHVEHIVSCDGRGIFNMPDESIECRNEECLDSNKILLYNDHIFNYPFGVESCFEENKWKKLSCDQMFNKLQPISKLPDIALPRNKIIRTTYLDENLKKYFEDHEIVVPTKFHYDKEKEECVPFKEDNIKEFLITKGMIKDDAVIYKSTSYGIRSLPFRLKDDMMLLDPKEFGYKESEKLYAIFGDKIYHTGGDNYKGEEWKNSEDYYSFISPITKEPKKIGNEITILDKMYDEVDGIYYALCIKYHKQLKISINRVLKDVSRNSLTEFTDTTSKTVISSDLSEKYEINYKNLKSKFILPEHFPEDQFSWDKLFVGKYFYDKINKNFIIWHDQLFIIKVIKPQLIIKKTVNIDGQFVMDNFPTNTISSIYYDDNKKFGKWNETALVTTFNYFGDYFDSPAPFWLSFIDISLEKLTEANILKFFNIVYPECQNEFIQQSILKSIIELKPLEIKIKNTPESNNIIKE